MNQRIGMNTFEGARSGQNPFRAPTYGFTPGYTKHGAQALTPCEKAIAHNLENLRRLRRFWHKTIELFFHTFRPIVQVSCRIDATWNPGFIHHLHHLQMVAIKMFLPTLPRVPPPSFAPRSIALDYSGRASHPLHIAKRLLPEKAHPHRVPPQWLPNAPAQLQSFLVPHRGIHFQNSWALSFREDLLYSAQQAALR